MIQLYKKYHIAYWCIGIALIVCMIISMILLWNKVWCAPLLVFFPTIFLVLVNAAIFTNLTAKKINSEIAPLLNNCEANKFLSEIHALFKDRAKNRVIISIYNSYLATGYAVINDYDSVYDCCQKITTKSYQVAKVLSMMDYYASTCQFEQAQNEIEKLRKMLEKMKNTKLKERCGISIMNVEYAIRIKQGNYEGAEEHYKKMMETVKPLMPLGKSSYSYALGRLLILKGEPERARDYLQTAYDLGGDTKYKTFAEKYIQELNGEKE